jgi:hypothetical protein
VAERLAIGLVIQQEERVTTAHTSTRRFRGVILVSTSSVPFLDALERASGAATSVVWTRSRRAWSAAMQHAAPTVTLSKCLKVVY